jgi:hypothetical protein
LNLIDAYADLLKRIPGPPGFFSEGPGAALLKFMIEAVEKTVEIDLPKA